MRPIRILSFASLFALALAGCEEKKSDMEKAADEFKKNAEALAKQAEKTADSARKAADSTGDRAAEAVADGKEAAQGAPEAMAKAMAEMQKAASGGATVEPVDFRELKALLPEKLADLPRKDAKGEKAGAMGIKISRAEGTYGGDDKSLEVKIVDLGSTSGPAGMAATAWSMAELDRETDDGYEKTTTIKGFKAFERYSKSSRSGELKVIVASRFVVEVDGHGVEMDAVKKALEQLDLAKLEGMKQVGVQR